MSTNLNTEDLSWIGLSVGEYTIEELIGEGSFSWVYKGTLQDNITKKAFKVAKPSEFIKRPLSPDGGGTGAFALLIGEVMPVTPDAAEVVALQAEKLMPVRDPDLPIFEDLQRTAVTCYGRMELVQGKTLRSLVDNDPVSLRIFISLARTLQRLENNALFKYHGNLTPENIMVTTRGIKLLDPGYWGPLECEEGSIPNCAVTTPAYYPSLEPYDLLALGLIIWEAALGQRPLGVGGDSEAMDLSRVGEDLARWVGKQELVGKFYLSPILELYTPSQLRLDMPPHLESFLLKAIQLRMRDDGILDKDPGFSSFDELADALTELLDSGIQTLGHFA